MDTFVLSLFLSFQTSTFMHFPLFCPPSPLNFISIPWISFTFIPEYSFSRHIFSIFFWKPFFSKHFSFVFSWKSRFQTTHTFFSKISFLNTQALHLLSDISGLRAKVKALALYVSSRMGGSTLNIPQSYEESLPENTTPILPIGKIKYGETWLRVILYKYLCDGVGIPCRVSRPKSASNTSLIWNSVPMSPSGMDLFRCLCTFPPSLAYLRFYIHIYILLYVCANTYI